MERRKTPSVRAQCVRLGLSARETDVMELLIGGKRTSDIAALLDISQATVQTHLRNAGVKLRCPQRSAMISKLLTA